MTSQQTNLLADALRPGDDGYDAAARTFFATGRPALVVRPREPDEVAAALRYAARLTIWRCRCARAGTVRSATARTPAGW